MQRSCYECDEPLEDKFYIIRALVRDIDIKIVPRKVLFFKFGSDIEREFKRIAFTKLVLTLCEYHYHLMKVEEMSQGYHPDIYDASNKDFFGFGAGKVKSKEKIQEEKKHFQEPDKGYKFFGLPSVARTLRKTARTLIENSEWLEIVNKQWVQAPWAEAFYRERKGIIESIVGIHELAERV